MPGNMQVFGSHICFCSCTSRRNVSSAAKLHLPKLSHPAQSHLVNGSLRHTTDNSGCNTSSGLQARLMVHCSSAGSDEAQSPVQASRKRQKLAVFVSGGGSNFRAIHAATQSGDIAADVVVSFPSDSLLVQPIIKHLILPCSFQICRCSQHSHLACAGCC